MKYYIAHHQHKGRPFELALRREGWKLAVNNPDIALFDHAVNREKPEEGRALIDKYYNEGSTILTYPHGATGTWWMDNDMYRTDDKLSGNLVIGEGHKHIEEIVQPTLKHYVTGWNFCPIEEFKKPKEVVNILFAPIHAAQRTNIFRDEAIETNARVFEALLKLPSKYKIFIRYLNPLNTIGLKNVSRVILRPGKPDGSYSEIDFADVVIAEGTYMYLSVARGKPTIGMNQHIPPRPNGYGFKEFKLKHWNEYERYLAYPIDFDDGDDLLGLINRAVKEEQSEWKRLFIGDKMSSVYLSKLLKNIRNGKEE